MKKDKTFKKVNKDDRDPANRDPITGAPGSHPVGTGVGAAAGGAAGAAGGMAAGAAAGTAGGGPRGGGGGGEPERLAGLWGRQLGRSLGAWRARAWPRRSIRPKKTPIGVNTTATSR